MARAVRGVSAGRRWQPDLPPPALRGVDLEDARWRRYLLAQGYTDQEAKLRLDGGAGEPGLRRWVRAQLEARQLDAAGVSTREAAVAGLVVTYLEQRPPAEVQELDPRPARYLSPADLGARLSPSFTEDPYTGGDVHRDRVDGSSWTVQPWSREQAAAAVTAGALYRLLGVDAPHVRLVEMQGQLLGAHPTVREWRDAGGVTLQEDHLEALGRELPADAWLGWTDGRAISVRELPTEVTGTSARVRLGYAMGWKGDGGRVRGWPESPVLSLDGKGVHRGATRARMLPTVDRIAQLRDAQLRKATELGAPSARERASTLSALLTRRELLLELFGR